MRVPGGESSATGHPFRAAAAEAGVAAAAAPWCATGQPPASGFCSAGACCGPRGVCGAAAAAAEEDCGELGDDMMLWKRVEGSKQRKNQTTR